METFSSGRPYYVLCFISPAVGPILGFNSVTEGRMNLLYKLLCVLYMSLVLHFFRVHLGYKLLCVLYMSLVVHFVSQCTLNLSVLCNCHVNVIIFYFVLAFDVTASSLMDAISFWQLAAIL